MLQNQQLERIGYTTNHKCQGREWDRMTTAYD